MEDRKGKKIIIGNCYRPPGASKLYDKQLQDQIIFAASKGELLIMGDFNYPGINWTIEEATVDNEFLEVVQDCFLSQHVINPTREDAILDLVLSTDPDIVCNLEVGEHLGNSDHNIIRFELTLQSEAKVNDMLVPDFFRADFDRLRLLLDRIKWNKIMNGKTTEEKWEIFKIILEKNMRECIPMKKRRSNSNNPKWFTKEVKNIFDKKQLAYRKFKASSKDEDRITYKSYQSELKKTIRVAKKNLEKKLADNINLDSKSFFSYVRSKQRIKEQVGPLMDSEGKLINEDIDIADELNKYFVSVFTKEDSRNFDNSIPVEGKSSVINKIIITTDSLIRMIDKMKCSKSPGPDNIYPRVIKEVRFEIVEALVDIFSSSIETGIIPDDWRIANVVPLFKKGSKKDPNNYRPISLTSVVGKLLESILKELIVVYLNENCLMGNAQHGFRNKRSCLTNLLEFYEEITSLVDEGNAVDLVFLDFQKAFDKVAHGRLIVKMKCKGIQDNILLWIQNWLKNRRQRVIINGKFSTWKEVSSGVPQGSVLGPLLFLIFIDDLDNNILSKISKFADDTKLGGKVNNIDEALMLQDDLNNLCSWASLWQMDFNAEKCQIMHLGRNNMKNKFYMNGRVIQEVDETRDLGILIHESLKPSNQCVEACKKANRMLGMLKRTIESRNSEVVIPLYKSLVRPHLEYCIQFWSPYYKKDIDILEKVQKRATKIIIGLSEIPYLDRLKMLGLYSLERRRLRGDMIQVFKIITGTVDLSIDNFFQVIHDSRTRGHKYKLFVNRSKLLFRKKFFSNRVVTFWNGLSERVIEAKSVESFKNRLDEFMDGLGIV